MIVARNSPEWREALALEYAKGTPVKEIASEFKCGMSYPGMLAKRAQIRLRLAGASWRRKAGHGDR